MDYEDVGHTQGVKAVTGLMACPGGANPPAFAPPLLQHGELVLSQMPNIMLYIGPRLKLTPESEAGKLHVNQLFLTACECVLCSLNIARHGRWAHSWNGRM